MAEWRLGGRGTCYFSLLPWMVEGSPGATGWLVCLDIILKIIFMPCTFIDSLIAGLILHALQQCTGINMSSISVVDLDSS